MNLFKALFLVVFTISISSTSAQITERKRPAKWDGLVYGGRFMDRFDYLPELGGMTSKTWGAATVIPRDINNGIESPEWSYWGGNPRLLNDKKYHLFVCRWPENNKLGHALWPQSVVVHTVADNRFGPYKVVEEVGKGHNPEWYITKNGKYVIYVIGGYYISGNVNGPWKYKKFDFDPRDRKIIEGLSNLSFAQREDGSFIMVSRGGGIWFSKDGVSTWYRVSDKSIYPPVDGRFEDPVIWKTENQYHLIVNDWYGRIAWYLRSKDGINWVVDDGEAYLPGIAKYKNGIKENWFKFERIKVLQDEHGRAVQAHFAVIDTLKKEDKGGDNHSSKNLVIPLKKGKLLSVLNKKSLSAKTKTVKVLIKKESGFDPDKDIDLESLRFGAPKLVNFGKGSKVAKVKKTPEGVIVSFSGRDAGFAKDDFTGKLLGKDKNGELIFGYTKLPGIKYIEPILSARKPELIDGGSKIEVKIENFGQVASNKTELSICLSNGNNENEIAKTSIAPISPFEEKTIIIKTKTKLSSLNKAVVVYVNKGKCDEVKNKFEN